MNLDDLTAWLSLTHAPNIGIIAAKRLLHHFGSAATIIKANIDALKSAGLNNGQINSLKKPNKKLIEQTSCWIERDNHHIIAIDDPNYPAQLREVKDSPLLLYIIGEPAHLNAKQIAIVGSRSATRSGLETAEAFAYALTQRGLTITSGLAIGIDGAAHRGAVAAKHPTIGVLGCGLHTMYPRRHQKLAAQMIENGALVSELPLSAQALPAYFPQRNRIISGLSLGTLVVEATLHSGSLITARLATEQGREVFAIPSAIQNSRSYGCHQLIQQGAKLVTCVQDILDEFPTFQPVGTATVEKSKKNAQYGNLAQQEREFLKYIGYETTTVDLIQRRSGLSIAKVTSMLLNLELHGYITATAGGYRRYT